MKNPVSHFSYPGTMLDIKRSTFDRNHKHKTTMTAGYLYPIFLDEYLPGDTFSLDLSVLARMSTPLHPVMDDAFMDVMFFSVPYRQVWDSFKQFMGESPEDPYTYNTQRQIPQLVNGGYVTQSWVRGVLHKSVLDYMGVPGTPDTFSALPVRAFCHIWNEWFRDQQLQNPIDFSHDDDDEVFAGGVFGEYKTIVNGQETPLGFNAYTGDYLDSDYGTAKGGQLPPVNKYHDYFTSALKQPQRGDPVPIPIEGFYPVYARDTDAFTFLDQNEISDYERATLKVTDTDGNPAQPGDNLFVGNGSFLSTTQSSPASLESFATFSNLWTDLRIRDAASAYATINDLRYAYQVQKLLEADNRFGTRYRELIYGHFNVLAPQIEMQVPEYLGGKRIRIGMQQVLQTSASADGSTPQGNTAAYSLTADVSNGFTKSFTEHGIIIGVACVRTAHTYSQGFERFWRRKDRLHFFWPELSNISEQPVYNAELYSKNELDEPTDYNKEELWREQNEIFGFQEAWAEYRYKPDRISGEFSPDYPQSLDSWHYGDDYDDYPRLSDEWIRETRVNIDRTLAVPSDLADQFLCDFYFKYKCTRPMPIVSVPGLSDHH